MVRIFAILHGVVVCEELHARNENRMFSSHNIQEVQKLLSVLSKIAADHQTKESQAQNYEEIDNWTLTPPDAVCQYASSEES